MDKGHLGVQKRLLDMMPAFLLESSTGLKPVECGRLMSELKLRPPKSLISSICEAATCQDFRIVINYPYRLYLGPFHYKLRR